MCFFWESFPERVLHVLIGGEVVFQMGDLTFKWRVCPMWGGHQYWWGKVWKNCRVVMGVGHLHAPPPPPIMRNPAMTLIWPYCDQSRSGHNFPHLKIVQRRTCIIFINHSITDIWQSWDYAWNPECNRVLSMALVLNMPGFCIYKGSENATVLNIPEFLIIC